MTTKGNILYSNTYKQTPIRGLEDEKVNFNKIVAKLNNTEDEQITSAGDMVKLVAGANGVPTVAEVEATENYSATTKYGFIPLARKHNEYKNNDMLTVALSNSVMYMIAQEAIACGDYVAYDATTETPTNTGTIIKNPSEATAGKIPCGFALDTATQAGDLVRVMIL